MALGMMLVWLCLLAGHAGSGAQLGKVLFIATGILALIFCLFAGIFLTADCLSSEKREGTLGLLFLTDLKGYDVVLGKLVATSLGAFYGLLAILPLLGLPLLIGGVSGAEFWRVTLALIVALLFSLSLGMFVSAVTRETRQAMSVTLLLLVGTTGVLPVAYTVQSWLSGTSGWEGMLWPSPVYLYRQAFDGYFGSGRSVSAFWCSLLTIAVLSLGAIILASLCLPRSWRQKGEMTGTSGAKGRSRWRFGSAKALAANRFKLQENPIYWLGTRDRMAAVTAWGIVGFVLPLWFCFLASSFLANRGRREMCFSICFFISFALHQLLKYMVAVEASRRFSEDGESGALELMLASPLRLDEILGGQSRALNEIFRIPIYITLLTNACLFMVVIVPNSLRIDGEAAVIFSELFLGGGVLMLADYFALKWVGMRMGLRAKKHPRAIFGALARIQLVPWLAVLLVFFLTAGGGTSADAVIALFFFWLLFSFVLDFVLGVRSREELANVRELLAQAGGAGRQTVRAGAARIEPIVG